MKADPISMDQVMAAAGQEGLGAPAESLAWDDANSFRRTAGRRVRSGRLSSSAGGGRRWTARSPPSTTRLSQRPAASSTARPGGADGRGDVTFGAVAFDLRQVTLRGTAQPWTSVLRISLHQGNLVFRVSGYGRVKERDIVGDRIGMIPNYPLLWELMQLAHRRALAGD